MIGGVRVVDIAAETGIDFIIPEPGTMLTFGSLALLAAVRRRRAVI